MTTINPAKKEDIKNIVDLHRKCVSETNVKDYDSNNIDRWLSQIDENNVSDQFENTTWVVIKEDNIIVGFAQYDLSDTVLYQIQIDPKYQGKGYGKKLYQHIENIFIKYSKDKISLNATLNAVSFYARLGFKRLKSISYDGIEMISMEKKL